MVKFEELKKLRPSAWTSLISQELGSVDARVISIERELVPDQPTMERYLLTLAGYREPVSLMGKHTNALEATFYEDLAPFVDSIPPTCLFSHVSGDQSWLILKEAYNDWTMDKWTFTDIESIVIQLASLHAEYWDGESRLSGYGLETLLSESLSENEWENRRKDRGDKLISSMQLNESEDRIASQPTESSYFLSEHALRSLGNLDKLFNRSLKGIEALLLAGGWPGIIDDKHLEALIELLDDPLPVLHPLRHLPATLLHGDPAPGNWHISLFDDIRLLNWTDIVIGPGIYDLVNFIEQLDLLEKPNGDWEYREHWSVSEETIIDSYILEMRQKLGTQFNSREVRQAVSAARCFYLLSKWLPRFDDWFKVEKVDKEVWLEFAEMSDDQLRELGFGQVANLRPYLKNLFDRFLVAYYSL